MMSAHTKMRFHTLATREKDRPRARACARAGALVPAWAAGLGQGVFPGAGFWKAMAIGYY